MENMEWNKIRRQSLFKVLPPKLLPVTKNFPTPSEFLLRNNLSDRIDNIEMSQKVLQPIPILVTTKIQKTSKDFQKILEIKTRGTTVTAKQYVATTTKNNDSGMNDCNITR